MKKIRLAAIFLALALLAGMLPPALAAPKIEVGAAAALLVEQETGMVLFSQNASARREPASLTKLMTALLIAEDCEEGRLDPDDTIVISESVFNDLEGRSSLKFSAGEEITVMDALACALVASVNESCNMLAEASSGGDRAAFVARMNDKAKELGCAGTHFANTHGLPNEEHYSTAEDICRIFVAAAQYPLVADTAKLTTYTLPATNMADARTISTTNRLLLKDSAYYYPYALYGKTGTTNAAGNCLATCAEKDNIRLVAVVLGAPSVQNEDQSTTIMSFVDSRHLYEWGYENFGHRTVLDTTDLICEIPVTLGDGANSVVLRPEKSVTVYMDLTVPAEEIARETELYSEELQAPVEAGEVYGRVTLSYGGQRLGSTNLVSNTSVKLLHIEYLRSEIRAFFGKTWVRLMIAAVLFFIILYILYLIYVGRRKRAARRKKLEERRREEAARAQEKPDWYGERESARRGERDRR